MRTEHAGRQSRCCPTYPQVRRVRSGTVTAFDRTWQLSAAPILPPESDAAQRSGQTCRAHCRLAQMRSISATDLLTTGMRGGRASRGAAYEASRPPSTMIAWPLM